MDQYWLIHDHGWEGPFDTAASAEAKMRSVQILSQYTEFNIVMTVKAFTVRRQFSIEEVK